MVEIGKEVFLYFNNEGKYLAAQKMCIKYLVATKIR